MAEQYRQERNQAVAEQYRQERNQAGNVSGRSVACASLAGVALSAPLLGMMGFSFLATLTLLAITSPLLLIFSPLLLMVGLLFAGALAGFAVSAAMAFAGFSALAFMYKEVKGSPLGNRVTAWFAEFGNQGKEQARDWGGYLQQKGKEQAKDWGGYLQQKGQEKEKEKEYAPDYPNITNRG